MDLSKRTAWSVTDRKVMGTMDKFIRIVGIIVVAWLALSLIGWVFGFLFKAAFWIILIGGSVALGAYLASRKNGRVTSRN